MIGASSRAGVAKMEILTDSELGPGRFVNGVVTIGNFDGVHLGHQALLDEICRRAEELGGPSIVYTFDPHPLRVLNPAASPPTLTDFEDKARRIALQGVDVMVRVRFDREYAARSPEDFARGTLSGELGAKEIWIGPDFAFGRGRKGNLELMSRLGAELGFGVHSLPAFMIDGQRVSSTRVRQAVGACDFAGAQRLLGRPYELRGVVAHGHNRGEKLGYPTANLVPREECIPPEGVYAAWVDMRGRRRVAAVNVGHNPTFGDVDRVVEAHILDYDEDLYGELIALTFVEAIRGEIAFSSVEALVEQIGADVARVRELLSDGPALAGMTGCAG